MNAVKHLERDAMRAHNDGDTWRQFYYHHGDAIRTAEPYDRGRYHKLVNRLLALVTSGNLDGMEPVGDALEASELGGNPSAPSDTATQACCSLWADEPLPSCERNSGDVAQRGEVQPDATHPGY